MQGRKDWLPKMMYQVHLDELVPKNNFYRLLDRELDLHFLYKATEQYYGDEGQESIDPVVFFKICLVGYLNNINSDRKLIEYCSDSFAIRLYLKYDIDEALPWHSTISRTRQLYGEEVFLSLFCKVLSMCVEKGMVSGKRQAIDSAFIKANASLESLVSKEVLNDAVAYADELNNNSEYKVTSEKKKQIERRNHTHYSSTDPDARISTKPGKPKNLNYLGQVAVDTSQHVITGAMADFADKRDSQCLQNIVEQTSNNLLSNALQIEEIVADSGYSSGEALQYCEKKNINAYIPNFGLYKPEREGFLYNEKLDQYECQRGNKATLAFKGIRKRKNGPPYKLYMSSESGCKECFLKEQCCGKKNKIKQLAHSVHKEFYDRMHKKLTENKIYARRMSRLRSSTVEPVLGTLINFLNMKRVNTRGIDLTNKHVLMASLTYNLKKYIKFISKKIVSQAIALQVEVKTFFSYCFTEFLLIFSRFKPIYLATKKTQIKLQYDSDC